MLWKYHSGAHERWNSALAHLRVAQMDRKLSAIVYFSLLICNNIKLCDCSEYRWHASAFLTVVVWLCDYILGNGTELTTWQQLQGIFFFFLNTAGMQLLLLSSCCYLKRRCDDDLLGPFRWKRSIEFSSIWIAFLLLLKLSWAYLWKRISGFSFCSIDLCIYLCKSHVVLITGSIW